MMVQAKFWINQCFGDNRARRHTVLNPSVDCIVPAAGGEHAHGIFALDKQ